MLGSILFAYLRGSSLDSECKKWRLFADVVNDVSFLVDLVSFHSKSLFLPLQCFSGLMRSLVGVAGGATRAALTQHQARRNNLADVSAKDSSQETLVNLVALVFNLMIIPIVVANSTVVWTLFSLLTFLHVFCNYKAVRAVNIEVFNMSRLKSTIKRYFQSGEVLTPPQANQIENVWFFIPEPNDIRLGVTLSQHGDLKRLLDDSKHQKYIISIKNTKSFVSIQKYAQHLDIIKSVFHSISAIDNFDMTSDTIDEKFNIFVTKCEKAGWNLEKQLLNCDEYRYDYV